jgi:hypothetical protein
VEAVL